MSDSIKQLTGDLRESNSTKQQEQISNSILSRCRANPETIDTDEVIAIFETLQQGTHAARLNLSAALFHLGKASGETIVPIAADIVDFLVSETVAGQVRINLGRPVGDAIAEKPDSIRRNQLPKLGSEINDDEKWYRHSIVWALELLAFYRPVEVFEERERLLRHLDDEHPPARKHACRAVAHLERHQSFLDEQHIEQLGRCIDHDEPAVRTAASIALGAAGGTAAIAQLQEQYRNERETSVQIDIRHALREATFPATDDVLVDGEASTLGEGQWIAVTPKRVTPRTGRFRGRVMKTVGTSSTSAPLPERAVLANPFEGYVLELTTDDETVNATYRDRRKSDELAVTVQTLERIDDDHVALLYALEEDTLDAKLDRTIFDITIEEITHIERGRRVIGSDTRGNTIEFRPCEDHPLLSRFHSGRCFDSHRISLRPAHGDKETDHQFQFHSSLLPDGLEQ